MSVLTHPDAELSVDDQLPDPEASGQRPEISVVIPVLNEAESLPILIDELEQVMQTIGRPYEVIFVDDGSRDRTPEVLRATFEHDRNVQVIQFRRNFGKSAALAAGFEASTGEIIVTMDGDLQDVPAEIPRLLERLDDGTDLVSGWKFPRHDPMTKRLPSGLFNSVVRLMTGITIHDFNCGFKVYRREVIEEIPLYGELHRYIPVLAHNKGFQVAEAKVQHRPRQYGKSKFGGTRFARGFFDLATVLFLTQYNLRPLHFFGWFGIVTFSLGFVINAYLAILWFFGQPIGTRPLLTLGVLLMIIGGQFFVFGLLAEMIAHTADSTDGYSVRRHLRNRNQDHVDQDNDLD